MTPSLAGSPLTWEYYSDPAIYRRECKHIFTPHWLFVTHGARVPQPRDAIVTTVAQDSILVRRSDDNRLYAFHNLCRHRGAPLLGPGTHERTLLRCPYHGWKYDDHGNLVSAPRFNESSLPEQPELLSLLALEVAGLDGMVFVRSDTKVSSSLDTALAPISDLLDAFEFPLLEFDSTLDFVFNCNWKLYVENWLESYHFPWMHKSFISDVNIDNYKVEVRDHAVCHRAQRTSDQSVYAGAWLWLWPLTAWNSYDGGLSIERIIPEGPERTRIEFTFLFAAAVENERRETARHMCATVTSEDGAMCEMVHRTISGGRFVPGPLSPLHEGAIGYFHHLIREALDL